MVATNQFLPKCTEAIKTGNLIAGEKCWKQMVTQLKTFRQSAPTEILDQLITDSYDGDETRLLRIVKFIQNTFEKGSDLAINGYKALLNDMDSFGHLYLKNIRTPNIHVGGGLESYTYRTLTEIRYAEGETSPIFTQTLRTAVNIILSGKEIFIRNNVTRGFMYAPQSLLNSDVKIVVAGGNNNDPRYIWKLKPVESRWDRYNQESFYIVNTFENKILAVSSGDGTLQLVEATEEKYESTWSMFYIQLIQGGSGEEVIIQCSFWGLKTISLDRKDDWKVPKLLESNTLEDSSNAIWLLQPKV